MDLPYQVPGVVEVLAQPDTEVCWATAFTILKAWKDQASYEIAVALETVGQSYVDLFNSNNALPEGQFASFLSDAGLHHLAPQNLSIEGWLDQLKTHGLTWVGTMNSVNPGAGLHSRVVQGMEGDGTADGTFMRIIDPDGGKAYRESISVFIKKYEDAYVASGDDQYIQIRFY